MAEFVYLFRGGEQPSAPAELAQHMQQWGAWMKEMGVKGVFKSGEPLEAKGKTVTGKQKTVTDGPFAEAKDLIGGFMIVTANDIDHAVEASRGCPILEIDGAVEVRPVLMRNMLDPPG